jgi:hypothetical protein
MRRFGNEIPKLHSLFFDFGGVGFFPAPTLDASGNMRRFGNEIPKAPVFIFSNTGGVGFHSRSDFGGFGNKIPKLHSLFFDFGGVGFFPAPTLDASGNMRRFWNEIPKAPVFIFSNTGGVGFHSRPDIFRRFGNEIPKLRSRYFFRMQEGWDFLARP